MIKKDTSIDIDIILLVRKDEIIHEDVLKSWEKNYKNIYLTNSLKLNYELNDWIDELLNTIEITKSSYLLISPSDFISFKKLPISFETFLKTNTPDYCRLTLRPGGTKIRDIEKNPLWNYSS